MERAARLLAQLKPARRVLRDRDLAAAAWPAAVGKQVAARTRVLRVEERRLIVAVEDILYQRNLQSLTRQILANLRDLVGSAAPESIEFVLAPQRRSPQREFRLETASRDEADSIADPGLRRIYVNSRKKALA
jgi:hypothetical protein